MAWNERKCSNKKSICAFYRLSAKCGHWQTITAQNMVSEQGKTHSIMSIGTASANCAKIREGGTSRIYFDNAGDSVA